MFYIHKRIGELKRASIQPKSQVGMCVEYRDHMFFHALTFVRSYGSCLNTRLLGRVFKHRPRDLASVNAMKQTCVIVIFGYFT